MSTSEFEHAETFARAETSGNLQLDKFATYEKLFAEALEDGVITSDERSLLDKAAESLGLDPERLRRLEAALTAAYESHYGVAVRQGGSLFAPAGVPVPEPVAVPAPPDSAVLEQQAARLQARVQELEARVFELERELEQARSQVAVEVDLSELHETTVSETQAALLGRRLKHDPRDVESLRALYRVHAGDPDRRWCVAHALFYLGGANEEQRQVYQSGRTAGLIVPSSALTSQSWRRYLFHPDDEVLTGDILSIIVSAVLLGHVGALRSLGMLPPMDPKKRLDPEISTVAAARCFRWAAEILGMAPPALYADPGYQGTVRMLPNVPPVTSLGSLALSGRLPSELAFLAGRHLAFMRQERFIRLLVPGIVELEDLFLAALTIGNPSVPLGGDVKRRVQPIATAIEPLLEPTEIDRLRGAFLRFVEQGGRTNLQRWAVAADCTATRAGLLLCDNLLIAEKMLQIENVPQPQLRAQMDDLLTFVIDERYHQARQEIGIALTA